MVSETGCSGSKGSCKKPCTSLERSLNWLNFFVAVVVGSFPGTQCTHTDWHMPGSLNELSLRCEAVPGFHRIGIDWIILSLLLWGCSASANCMWKIFGLSNGRSWLKWTSVRIARSGLLIMPWDCACKFTCLERGSSAAGTCRWLHSYFTTLFMKQQLGLVCTHDLSVFGMGLGKAEELCYHTAESPSLLPHSSEPQGQSAALAGPGPPGDALPTCGGWDPRGRCALGRLYQRVCHSPTVHGQHGVSPVVQSSKCLHWKGGQGLEQAAQGGGLQVSSCGASKPRCCWRCFWWLWLSATHPFGSCPDY